MRKILILYIHIGILYNPTIILELRLTHPFQILNKIMLIITDCQYLIKLLLLNKINLKLIILSSINFTSKKTDKCQAFYFNRKKLPLVCTGCVKEDFKF